MLVFLRCDFIQSISFVHITATRKTKTASLCISSFLLPPPPFFFTSGEFFSFYFSLLFSYPPPLPPFIYCLLLVTVNFIQQHSDESSYDSTSTRHFRQVLHSFSLWSTGKGVASLLVREDVCLETCSVSYRQPNRDFIWYFCFFIPVFEFKRCAFSPPRFLQWNVVVRLTKSFSQWYPSPVSLCCFWWCCWQVWGSVSSFGSKLWC